MTMTVQHKFVESVPEIMEEGVIYVSIPYCTAMHLCVCGCGKEVVTRISPTDWQLKFDGESISLNPSIGNWNFDCRSHYWITNNRVRFAENWSDEKVAQTRISELGRREKIYATESSRLKEIMANKSKRKPRFQWLKSFLKF